MCFTALYTCILVHVFSQKWSGTWSINTVCHHAKYDGLNLKQIFYNLQMDAKMKYAYIILDQS